jgi:hypothetical protein
VSVIEPRATSNARIRISIFSKPPCFCLWNFVSTDKAQLPRGICKLVALSAESKFRTQKCNTYRYIEVQSRGIFYAVMVQYKDTKFSSIWRVRGRAGVAWWASGSGRAGVVGRRDGWARRRAGAAGGWARWAGAAVAVMATQVPSAAGQGALPVLAKNWHGHVQVHLPIWHGQGSTSSMPGPMAMRLPTIVDHL